MKNILYGCVLLLFLYSCKKTDSCSEPVCVYGCMDSTATNYDSLATIADSSCWVVSVDIFPNPSDGVFNIEVYAEDVRTLKMSVSTLVGTVIFTSEQEEFTGVYVKEIDLTGNDIGLYFLQVYIDEDEFLRQLLLID
jgi:predicted RNA-binding protein